MTGGFNDNAIFKSVEIYDYYENKWTYLPDMIEKRSCHAAVSIGNKMFVIGGYHTSTCEIFHSFSRKFTYIKSINYHSKYECPYEAVCIGHTIVVFYMKLLWHKATDTKIIIYDVKRNKWSEMECSVLENLSGVSCAKYYID